MRAYSAFALAIWLLGQELSGVPLDVSFHHIHVNDPKPDDLIAYYERLFRPETTRPARIGDARGIESQGVFLLIDASRVLPRESGSAGWHFGWGSVSVDEGYDRHRMQEIEWELPLESFAKGLHLHLESETPLKAAEWYRDTFGARLEIDASNADAKPLSPIHRRPVAIARLDKVALAIYQSVAPLDTSRGQRIDHIAFRTDLEKVRRRAGLNVVNAGARLGAFPTMLIEGPDHLVIELVGPPSFPPSLSRSEPPYDSEETQLPTPKTMVPGNCLGNRELGVGSSRRQNVNLNPI